MKTIIALFVSLILLTASLPAQEACGPVILCGGGSIPTEALKRLQDSKLGGGRFIVVSCEKPREGRWETLDPIFALPEQVKDFPIDSICGLIIEGGDQWLYLNRLPADYIQKAHEHGIPILGTSAGSMILGEHYFTAEKDTITSEQAKENINVCLDHKYVNIKWLKGKIIDTHFNRRNRKGRLEVFVDKSGADSGFGIDEQTALFVDATHFDIIGEGTVTVVKKTTTVSALPVSQSEVAKVDSK